MNNTTLLKFTGAVTISALFLLCAVSVFVSDMTVGEDEPPSIYIVDGDAVDIPGSCHWDKNTYTLTVAEGTYSIISETNETTESNANDVFTIVFEGDCTILGASEPNGILSDHAIKLIGNDHSLTITNAFCSIGGKSIILDNFKKLTLDGKDSYRDSGSATLFSKKGNIEIRNCESVELIARDGTSPIPTAVLANEKFIVENSQVSLTFNQKEHAPKTDLVVAKGGIELSDPNIDSGLKCFDDLDGKSPAEFNKNTKLIICEGKGTFTLNDIAHHDPIESETGTSFIAVIGAVMVAAIILLFAVVVRK